ncbi:MAG: type II toxin-antitoxin system YafQ family toxin [Rhodospirillaceae bacterium]|jgi:mRNA interferase YafQ|nr:type II toxin-antitoxin system YafQ family toxin [Rhodospirillaceae bacterium]MBT3494260.1 type II toxin-antitoxin system YafQ family toxin [Rhodospirillaceae bacterium]MBT3778660.1 type II toxin-antitoxin system YafQ family toxin [Rhodospirillaceae bacterium]MBT3979199.1 type II toxin-antitoxin system YafQ family toxin [Rhodospirillaceae bacterium]MBT4170730.1 type II toxin-antitoxin system YafQ family toxin [Rhodospirillaceae bacterium]
MLVLKVSKQFKRDLKKASRQGRDIGKLGQAITELQHRRTLETAFRDHGLTGNWRDHRECHIAPDWLLIYKITDDELRLARLGSHSELY